ncbi:MAG: hypothetical protein PVH17_01565 [Anaerolineae bacterium]|jgi:hypothetical protein
MKLSTMMVIKAVICLVFGLGGLLLPDALMSLYDVSLGSGGAFVTRLFGASLLVLCVLLWQARTDTGSEAQQAIVLGVFVGDTIAFIVALIAQLSGQANALGWTTVAIYLLLAVGFGYFQLAKPELR